MTKKSKMLFFCLRGIYIVPKIFIEVYSQNWLKKVLVFQVYLEWKGSLLLVNRGITDFLVYVNVKFYVHKISYAISLPKSELVSSLTMPTDSSRRNRSLGVFSLRHICVPLVSISNAFDWLILTILKIANKKNIKCNNRAFSV